MFDRWSPPRTGQRLRGHRRAGGPTVDCCFRMWINEDQRLCKQEPFDETWIWLRNFRMISITCACECIYEKWWKMCMAAWLSILSDFVKSNIAPLSFLGAEDVQISAAEAGVPSQRAEPCQRQTQFPRGWLCELLHVCSNSSTLASRWPPVLWFYETLFTREEEVDHVGALFWARVLKRTCEILWVQSLAAMQY